MTVCVHCQSIATARSACIINIIITHNNNIIIRYIYYIAIAIIYNNIFLNNVNFTGHNYHRVR